jgi:hypothetical protein
VRAHSEEHLRHKMPWHSFCSSGVKMASMLTMRWCGGQASYACPVDASAPSAGCCDSWPIRPFSNGISGSASTW